MKITQHTHTRTWRRATANLQKYKTKKVTAKIKDKNNLTFLTYFAISLVTGSWLTNFTTHPMQAPLKKLLETFSYAGIGS